MKITNQPILTGLDPLKSFNQKKKTEDSAFAALTGVPEDKKTAETNAYSDIEDLLKEKSARDEFSEAVSKGGEGYWSWQIDNLKKKIASQVMSEMGVTIDDIATMTEDEKIKVSQKILDEVKRILEEMMKDEFSENFEENFELSGNFLGTEAISALVLMKDTGASVNMEDFLRIGI